MSDLQKPVAYVIKKGRPSGFKFIIEIDGKNELVVFTDNRYECPTAAHAAAIDELMAKPQFGQNIQKVDIEVGEAIARAHMEAQRPSAVQGGMTSDAAKAMEGDVARQNADDIADALAKANLMVTHDVKQEPAVPVSNKINIGGSKA